MRQPSDLSEYTQRTVPIPNTNMYARLDLAHIAMGWSILVATNKRGEDHTQEAERLYCLRKTDTTHGAMAGWNITRKTYEGREMREQNCQLYISEVQRVPGGEAIFLSPSVVMAQGDCLEMATEQDRRDSTIRLLGRIMTIQVVPPRRLASVRSTRSLGLDTTLSRIDMVLAEAA